MSKQVLTRQRVLELIDQLQVGQAIPSERRLSSDLGIRRLRLADGEPMALETLHVPAAIVPGLTREKLEDSSFYDLLEREYGVVISSGTQSIEPTVTNEEESELLGVPLHSPAFLFERTSRTASGETVEFVRSLSRGDRYRLVAELSQRRDRPASGQAALVTAE